MGKYLGLWIETEKIQDIEEVKRLWGEFEKLKSLVKLLLSLEITENSRHGKDWAVIEIEQPKDVEEVLELCRDLKLGRYVRYKVYDI